MLFRTWRWCSSACAAWWWLWCAGRGRVVQSPMAKHPQCSSSKSSHHPPLNQPAVPHTQSRHSSKSTHHPPFNQPFNQPVVPQIIQDKCSAQQQQHEETARKQREFIFGAAKRNITHWQHSSVGVVHLVKLVHHIQHPQQQRTNKHMMRMQHRVRAQQLLVLKASRSNGTDTIVTKDKEVVLRDLVHSNLVISTV